MSLNCDSLYSWIVYVDANDDEYDDYDDFNDDDVDEDFFGWKMRASCRHCNSFKTLLNDIFECYQNPYMILQTIVIHEKLNKTNMKVQCSVFTLTLGNNLIKRNSSALAIILSLKKHILQMKQETNVKKSTSNNHQIKSNQIPFEKLKFKRMMGIALQFQMKQTFVGSQQVNHIFWRHSSTYSLTFQLQPTMAVILDYHRQPFELHPIHTLNQWALD